MPPGVDYAWIDLTSRHTKPQRAVGRKPPVASIAIIEMAYECRDPHSPDEFWRTVPPGRNTTEVGGNGQGSCLTDSKCPFPRRRLSRPERHGGRQKRRYHAEHGGFDILALVDPTGLEAVWPV